MDTISERNRIALIEMRLQRLEALVQSLGSTPGGGGLPTGFAPVEVILCIDGTDTATNIIAKMKQ